VGGVVGGGGRGGDLRVQVRGFGASMAGGPRKREVWGAEDQRRPGGVRSAVGRRRGEEARRVRKGGLEGGVGGRRAARRRGAAGRGR
jgi:hypothetical protein